MGTPSAMKITAAAHHYRLPLRANWLTAAGSFGEREGWLLRLEPGEPGEFSGLLDVSAYSSAASGAERSRRAII